jgi:WD40 repeat protein
VKPARYSRSRSAITGLYSPSGKRQTRRPVAASRANVLADGRLLLATGLDVQTRDDRTGALAHALVGHVGPVSRSAFSPDGQWIATTGPTTVGLWRRDADRPFFYLRRAGTVPKGKLLTSASFSPDRRFVLASGRDGAVRLYRCEICCDLPALLELARARLRELRH